MKAYAGPPLPFAISLLACEQIQQHSETNQYSLRRVLMTMQCEQFPVQSSNLCLYAELSDIEGVVHFELRLVKARNGEVIWGSRIEADVPHKSAILQLCVDASGATFPEAGEYRAQLLFEGTLLLERPITLVPVGAAVN